MYMSYMSLCIYMLNDNYHGGASAERNTLMTDSPITTPPLPLGFRLRLIDRLLAREFGSAFEAEGVTRREWRALNLIAGTSPVPPALAGHPGGKHRGIRRLAERGWVTRDGDTLSLTDEGRAAKSRLDEIAEQLRTRVAGAVSEDDFDTLQRSLDAIARELGWNETQPLPPRPSRGRGFGRRHGFGRHGFEPHGFGPDTGFSPDAGFGRHGLGPHAGHGRHRFGRPDFGPHREHADHGCGDAEHGHHRHGGHGGSGGHRAVAEAFERGFTRGYEQAQRD